MKTVASFAAFVLAMIFALALPDASQDSHPGNNAATADPAWSELVGSMGKMHVAMASVRPSGDGDADFVRLMLPHHQAAVDMARTQLLYGKDPQLRRLALEIITDQQSEIELMQLWQKQHHPDSPKAKTDSLR